MNTISDQLLYQRLRNRVVEVIDGFRHSKDIAKYGAFESINVAYDFLPFDYLAVPLIFTQAEQTAITEFEHNLSRASDATITDTWDEIHIIASPEWAKLIEQANICYDLLMVRGRCDEESEDPNFQ